MTLNTMLPYYVGSLHGLGFKLLQNKNLIILDENDSKDLINNIIINKIKDNNIIQIMQKKFQAALDYASTTYPIDFISAINKYNLIDYQPEFYTIYNAYRKIKSKEMLLDFNDLMINLYEFLKSEHSVYFRQKIKYMFFDEYQDVNPIQNKILLLLSEYSNIMVVGDDSQSIYSFRGSSINHILNYDKDFNKSKKYLLVENYRSTPSIINLCQDIINNNTTKYDKKVISKKLDLDKEEYHKPTIIEFIDRQKQYEWIVQDILNKINNQVDLSEIAILSKKNQSINDIEELLINNNISCIKNNNTSLLNKSYIRNIISLINLKNKNINTLQSILWKRILKLHNLENSISDNYLESLKSYFDLPNVKDLYNIIIDDECNLDNIINYICSTNNQVNLDDINLFLSKINKTSYETILQSINSLYLNDSYNCNTDSIELSTIHGSKGLEWKFVYLIDMNSKDYPKSKNENECEEERRLFYVASSRAKNHLYISYHKNETEKIYQSPYIKEINKDFFEYIIN
jgi:DNA helicase-2/ATP-dependent DNA helicase PcrA